MSNDNLVNNKLSYYPVWDRVTRCFHWINLLCILGLITIGVIILNSKLIGVSGEGKILLKTFHVYIGYLFAINLIIRIIWGWFGNTHARWRAILPFGRGFLASLKAYMVGVRGKEAPQYLGHNPLGRLMVTLLFVLLTIQAATGLVLAGTDLYMPPFGERVVEWIAHKNPATTEAIQLTPGSKEGINPDAYAAMRDFRKPFIITHVYTFYILLGAIILHISGVILAEVRQRNSLISAMFNGVKVFSDKPVDK